MATHTPRFSNLSENGNLLERVNPCLGRGSKLISPRYIFKREFSKNSGIIKIVK